MAYRRHVSRSTRNKISRSLKRHYANPSNRARLSRQIRSTNARKPFYAKRRRRAPQSCCLVTLLGFAMAFALPVVLLAFLLF